MSKFKKQVLLVVLLMMSVFQCAANNMQVEINGSEIRITNGSVLKVYRNGALVEERSIYSQDFQMEANPDNYPLSDVKTDAEEDNQSVSDNKIKYDFNDIKRKDFISDVERNCILKQKEGVWKYYACSDSQYVIITEDALFLKKESEVNNHIFNISETEYSYVIYGLLLLLLLVFI